MLPRRLERTIPARPRTGHAEATFVAGHCRYGSLSSDGHAVFVLEGIGALPQTQEDSRCLASSGYRDATNSVRPYNVLSAYELRSRQGKRIWSVGGVGDDAKPPLDQLVFLGPPLPLEGSYTSSRKSWTQSIW